MTRQRTLTPCDPGDPEARNVTMLPAAAPGGVEEYPDLWHALFTLFHRS
jgi:hypothetical protein